MGKVGGRGGGRGLVEDMDGVGLGGFVRWGRGKSESGRGMRERERDERGFLSRLESCLVAEEERPANWG